MMNKLLDFAIGRFVWLYVMAVGAVYLGSLLIGYAHVFDSDLAQFLGQSIFLNPGTIFIVAALALLWFLGKAEDSMIVWNAKYLLYPYLLASWVTFDHFSKFFEIHAATIVLLAMNSYLWVEKVFFQKENVDGSKQKQQWSQPTWSSQEQQNENTEEKVRYRVRAAEGSFATILGMAEAKVRLLEAGQEIIRTTSEKKKPRNGILLFGKPGNGKTIFADALAGELKLPILSVSYGDLASKWVNETTENVAKVFRDAALQAPCLLFIDEIDSLIRDRSDSGGNSAEGPQITNTILTEIVNLRKAGVVIVAATNFLDKLDPAAIREGRFDYKIEITPPDLAARAGLIDKFSGIHEMIVNPETRDMAAKRWEGFSVARISAIVEETGRILSKQNRKNVEFIDLQTALRQVQGRKGNIPENTPSLDELAMTAAMRDKLKGVARRMKHIEEVEKMGGTVPSGLLFYGPPGTGKSVTARALAKESGWGFLSVSGADLMANASKIDGVLADASDIRPCIVFLDEADDILGDRRYSGNVSALTNKLLAAMDGSGGKIPDVVFVAATNHPEVMDSAALRGGRFTEKIEFSPPTLDVVEDYAKRWMKTMKAKAGPDMSAIAIAERVNGESIANIKEVLQTSINVAIGRCELGRDEPVVGLADIEEACQMVLAAEG